MLTRKRRFLVGSVSSLVWPAVTLLVPMGITFAAARVYAEAAPAPEACDAAAVVECADAAVATACHNCPSGTCACFSGGCMSGSTFNDTANTCRDIQKCEDVTTSPCTGGLQPGECMTMLGPGTCIDFQVYCAPKDGGPAGAGNFQTCEPKATTGSSSSSGGNGGSTSGTFIPGPPTVPGSSGASSTPASSDDSGCATSQGTTLPLFAAPIALGLLFALRRKKKR